MRISLPALLLLACLAVPERSFPAYGLARPGPEVEILRIEDRREYGPELMRWFPSPDPAVRARAALAAGRIGRVDAVEPLGALLRDVDPDVRAAAAFALGEIEDSIAAGPLSLLLRSELENDPRVRARAIEALGKLQAAGDAALCVAALDDSAAIVREAACLASWQMHAAGAVERLVELAESSEDRCRWTATYALMRMLGAPVSGRTVIPGGTDLKEEWKERIHALLLVRARDGDPTIRATAMRGLARFPDPSTDEAARAAFEDRDWRVRVEAVRTLSAIAGSGEGVAGTASDATGLSDLIDDPNPNVRLTALEALGVVGPDGESVRLIEPFLDGTLRREKQVAALALARRFRSREPAGPEATESILRIARNLVSSPAWSDRATAAEVLVAGAVPDTTLLSRLLHDEPRVAKTAIEPYLTERAGRRPPGASALALLRGDLDRLLSSPDPVLRAVTLETVGSILGDSIALEVRDEWHSLLESQWTSTRNDAENDVARAILPLLESHASTPAARRILREAGRSADGVVRRDAIRILRAVEPDSGPPDPTPVERERSLAEYASILDWAARDREVEIVTERGTIRIKLFGSDAPLTCWSFIRLAEAGFYDGGNWHRVVPDFVIQDGCPRGDGWGGPGYRIRCEINEHRHETGSVGMALSGKDTGGSQFFITHSPQPHLDGRYTVFGRVVSGMEVVDRLIQHDRIETIRPVEGH